MATQRGGDRRGLEAKLKSIFEAKENRNFQNDMVETINAFVNYGFKLDRKYTVGGLKGLMLLYGENYMDQEEFKKTLSKEIETLLYSKTPVVLRDLLHRQPPANDCSGLFRFLAR